jgi:hypothetical protein
MAISERDYFERRYREELDAAARSTSPQSRHVHARMAERYAEVLNRQGQAAA